MYERILVTGGAGFVGAAVCQALRRAWPGAEVVAFDNLRRRGSELNLERLSAAGVRFVHGDVRSAADLLGLSPAPQLIVECSAEPSAQAGYGGSPEYLVETNLAGCYHCLELARRCGADFVFVSTSRVYPYGRLNSLRYRQTPSRFELEEAQPCPGASAAGISEDFPLDGPRSLYGMTKLAAELMVGEYAAAYGLRYVINRCGLIAGPWQMGKTDQGVVALWAASHFFGGALSYIGFGGEGRQVRDVLHVDDFCDLLLEQLEHFSLYQGQIFNVGGGPENSLSLRELTDICQKLAGRSVPVGAVAETRPADVRIYVTDARRLHGVRGWKPRRSAVQAVEDIFGWLAEHEHRLRPVLIPHLGRA